MSSLQQTYEQLWETDAYRRSSPGEKCVDHFVSVANPEVGSVIYDVGCGTGRAGQRLIEKGYQVVGLDFAENAMDKNTTVPFIKWDVTIPPMVDKCDWVFCTDMLEHLEPERVQQSLCHIVGLAKWGCYFQISLRHSYHKGVNGETLHLTVWDAARWSEVFDQISGVRHKSITENKDKQELVVVLWVK